jgi:hypothetical protein
VVTPSPVDIEYLKSSSDLGDLRETKKTGPSFKGMTDTTEGRDISGRQGPVTKTQRPDPLHLIPQFSAKERIGSGGEWVELGAIGHSWSVGDSPVNLEPLRGVIAPPGAAKPPNAPRFSGLSYSL